MNGTKIRTLLAIFLISFGFQSLAAIGEVNLSKNPGKVLFKAVGKPAFLKITGKNGKVRGKAKINGRSVTGTFSVNLDEVKTGMGLRDRHMKENYLETKKFPKAFLKIKKLTLPSPIIGKGGKFSDIPFDALFKVHGVTKKIKGKANVTSNGKSVEVEANFSISIPDYNMGIPSFKGITVAKKVDIAVNIAGPIKIKK